MKRTIHAIDLARTASSTRPCALRVRAAAPGAPSANGLIDNKRNGFMGTRTGVPARRQRSLTT
jgi:hypothetical protein